MEEHKKTHQTEHQPEFQDEIKHHLGDAVKTFEDIGHPGKLNLSTEFKNAVEVIKLNAAKIRSVSVSKTSSLGAIIFILITLIITNFGNYFVYFRFGMHSTGISDLLITSVISLISIIFSIFAYDFIGSYFFHGKKSFRELFRVLGYGYLVMVISIIPVLTVIASIWYIIITYKILVEVKKLTSTNSILTILLSIVAVSIIYFVISLIIGGPTLQYYGMSAAGLTF
jgi:hypothetical protein